MADLPISATGPLADFLAAGVISAADFHTAERLSWHAGERSNDLAKLAFALTMRALRQGSVCLDLDTAHALASEWDEVAAPVRWPSAEDFRAALASSPIAQTGEDAAGCRPLRLVGSLTYLERYWRAERDVERSLRERRISELEARPAGAGTLNQAQERAVSAVGNHPVTVITGGPGTGKTRTAAAIVAAYSGARIALAAPTGKAAARLQESVSAELGLLGTSTPPGTTLHRLLGLHPARPNAPRHDASHPVPFDLVIVDEASMISLTMMRQLLAAVRPDAHLVLIGDRDQLASVDAGAVLADLVEATQLLPGGDAAVVELEYNYRFGGPIRTAATAIRDGDAEACLAALDRHGGGPARLVDADVTGLASLPGLRDRVAAWAGRLRDAAEAGDVAEATRALDSHRLLCAHREGPYGARRWNRVVSDWLPLRPHQRSGLWQVGHPLLVTQNAMVGASLDQVWNGDSGVIVATEQGPRAAIARAGEPLLVPPAILDGVAELYAMTIHKSQGSQFDDVSVILPPLGSPLLTRELAYTALTRAKSSVTIYGSPDALAEAIKTPARRASGLARFSRGLRRSR